jgi:hypothetical protein
MKVNSNKFRLDGRILDMTDLHGVSRLPGDLDINCKVKVNDLHLCTREELEW